MCEVFYYVKRTINLRNMELCRLCSEEKEELTDVVLNEDLALKIKECVSVTITKDDGLPDHVCCDCMQKVEDWSKFKKMCIKSDESLRNKFLNNDQIKTGNVHTENDTVERTNDAEIIDDFIKEESLDSVSYSEQEDEYEDDDKDFSEDFVFNGERDVKSSLPTDAYVCSICSKEFDSCLEYLDHQEEHNGDLVFKCSKCPEVFSQRSDLVEHDRNHKIPCRYCGIETLKSSMKLHVIKHTDKYICPQCSNHFHSKAILNQHIIAIHSRLKNHVCETCGKRFTTLTGLRTHLKIHSDEREYKCKNCSYAAKTASSLKIHMSTHDTGVCICEICSKTFKSNRNLYDHLRRVHTEEKKYACPQCGKKFVDKYMVAVHLRTHTGVRPYQCSVCDKAFIRSDSLKEHMATHGERIKYSCEKCGKKFTSKRGRSRHNCNIDVDN